MVRCFIGVMMPENSKMMIERLKTELKEMEIEGKFVEKENSHVSIDFLGEKTEQEIEEIKSKLDAITKNFTKFEVTICGLKLIPSEKFIRVIASEVRDETKTLNQIIERITEEIGGDSKPPHLTLCRVHNIKTKEMLIEKSKKYENACFAGFVIDRIQLIKSELSRSGPKYSVIHESLLS